MNELKYQRKIAFSKFSTHSPTNKCNVIVTLKFPSECCTSLGFWRGLIVASYGDGHLRVFDMETGRMYVEVAAHARWINALDVARNGLVTII